jgi:hypothetical protein
MDVIGHHLHPQHPIAIALLLLQDQFFSLVSSGGWKIVSRYFGQKIT